MTSSAIHSGDLVFLCGRLMRGHKEVPPGFDFDRYGAFVGYGFAQAQFFEIDHVPVLVPGEGLPFGILYRVDNTKAFSLIDEFLSVNTERPGYPSQVRQRVQITNGIRERLGCSAWAYFLADETLPKNARRIGNWPFRTADAGAGKFGEHHFRFGEHNTGPIRSDLGEAYAFLKETRRRGLYFHTVEGWKVLSDGKRQLDMTISKTGSLRGEDDFTSLEQHHEVCEMILNNAKKLEVPTEFEIWISDETDLAPRGGKQ